MSLKGFPEYDHRVRRMSTQRMNDSGELDVFEATRYFSSCNDVVGYNGGFLSQKAAVRDERFASGGRRMSLDMPTIGSIPSQSHRVDNILKEKRNKVPSSPGGKVASFLNSLFNQAASKKKKSKSSSLSMKDEEESPSGRRKRRSSISIFPSIKTHDLKSTATSGFRTPPSCIDTPTKGYKDVRSYTDHKVKPVASQGEVPIAKKEDMDLTWLDEKFKLIDNLSKEKNISAKDRIWVDKFSSAKGDSKKDYGYESDSSSDLFELNYEVGSVYSSDLPVYETTNMENIKRGPLICNGVM